MSELNAWLGRDVADRHNEMTAVVHRLEELRASLNELQNRPCMCFDLLTVVSINVFTFQMQEEQEMQEYQ